jgi:hypothetical protein
MWLLTYFHESNGLEFANVTASLFYRAMGLVLAAKLGTLSLVGHARPGYVWRAIRAKQRELL